MSVDTKHKLYTAMLPRWQLVSDAVAGSHAVKAQSTVYLPMPNKTDTTPENKARYEIYLNRAMFVEVTKTTAQSLIGLAFKTDPALEATGLELLEFDIDGAGNSIYQQSQQALSDLLKRGRCGLLVDYPQTDGGASIAAMRAQGIKPTVTKYTALDIINWHSEKIGGQMLLTLVVLSEIVQEPVVGNPFAVTDVQQYRALRLIDGVYTVEVWRDGTIVETYEPRQSNGQAWPVIPFMFVGAESNTPDSTAIPLESIATVNLHHYLNSADYEDSVYRVGQVQPYISGLDAEWRDHLEKTGVRIGSPTALMLPQGGQFGFAQAQPNMLPKEGMADKIKLMQSLGAKLIESGGVAKTATQDRSEQRAQHSVLSLCVSNLNEAYTQCLKWCAMFMGASEDVRYAVTQDFTDLSIDPALLTEMRNQNQAGLLPRTAIWSYLRKIGLIESELTDDDLTGQIDAEMGGGGFDREPTVT